MSVPPIQARAIPAAPRPRPARATGFSLVEMMVSMAILSMLLVVLLGILNQTSTTWRYTSGKIKQFRAARDAYDSITRRLGQATLNTYWDYDSPTAPTRYQRQSELRILTGPMATIAGTAPAGKAWTTHGAFFQTPVGFTATAAGGGPDATGLENLLNTWGYFVEFGDDAAMRPPFHTAPARYRYRLCEFMQPSNQLTIYRHTSGNPGYTGRDWFTEGLNAAPGAGRPVHALADNVIALVFIPKLSVQDDATETRLAPTLVYDSTTAVTDAAVNPKHQLPPVVEVTMVAIDEASAARLAQGTTAPDVGLTGLFVAGPGAAARVRDDLRTLQERLTQRRIQFRVFTSDVVIRGARWSTEQSN
ncbi:prepilin-type cleavage/methylation domain-containing protein [Verrucomicrobia bacterium LW23]|nr:prepilin-type cleavage/methylation domain-containing protein [Verrucomicrobia bacterium LW23]